MRRLALASLLLLTTAPRLDASTFNDLRAGNPTVDQAISRLPSNGLTGTLGHISSLLEQPRVARLEVGGDELPAGFNRQMAGALDRLADHLSDGLPRISIVDRIVLAQVVDDVVVERNSALLGGRIVEPCRDCPPSPARNLVTVVDILADSIRTGIVEWSERYNVDLSAASAAAAAPVTPQSLDGWLDAVIDNCVVPGIEHIDN
jgi:hypothetical protein